VKIENANFLCGVLKLQGCKEGMYSVNTCQVDLIVFRRFA